MSYILFQELISAAMGLNISAIEDPRIKKKVLPLRHTVPDPRQSNVSNSFAVTQALVGLLAKTGGIGLAASMQALAPVKGINYSFSVKYRNAMIALLISLLQ